METEARLLDQVGGSGAVKDRDGHVADEALLRGEARGKVGRQVEGEGELMQAGRQHLFLIL